MGQIQMNAMEFYAYHGCHPDEQLTGANFVADITMDYNMEAASDSDDLCDALNYAEAYQLVRQEMAIRSHLLEHLCKRILDSLFECFPQLQEATVCIQKINPPIDGQMRSVGVSQKRVR